MNILKSVQIIEVGPRDGFQNVSKFIPTEIKQTVVEKLINSGIKRIQITSFVSPKAIPQMRDAKELSEKFLQKYPDMELFALCPNLKGVEIASQCGYKEVSLVMSLSESHNKANINMSVQESLVQIDRIKQAFPDMIISQDIATAFGCPFEGEIQIDLLLELIYRINTFGINRIVLCDTIGIASPNLVRRTLRSVKKEFSKIEFNVHIHDTRNLGILNSFIAAEEGITGIQTSICGLGGCPFAPGAAGNTATEDLVYLFNKEGYKTDINFNKLMECAKFVQENIEGQMSGHQIKIDTSVRCI